MNGRKNRNCSYDISNLNLDGWHLCVGLFRDETNNRIASNRISEKGMVNKVDGRERKEINQYRKKNRKTGREGIEK